MTGSCPGGPRPVAPSELPGLAAWAELQQIIKLSNEWNKTSPGSSLYPSYYWCYEQATAAQERTRQIEMTVLEIQCCQSIQGIFPIFLGF